MEKEQSDEFYRGLYLQYGITEWHEKCQVLSSVEVISVLEDLKRGIDSPLVRMVKKPFPYFAKEYFEPYMTNHSYYGDPAFGYKLYLLDDTTLRYFAIKAREPGISFLELRKRYKIGHSDELDLEIRELFMQKFDEVPFFTSMSQRKRLVMQKYVYLTQYIDIFEASKMGMSIVADFIGYKTESYELEEKLNILNPASRLAIVLFLGLEGHRRHTQGEIQKVITLKSDEKLCLLLNTFLSTAQRPFKAYASMIGFRDREENTDNMFEYKNAQFQSAIISIETTYIFSQLDEATQKFLLSKYTRVQLRQYLAYKYMYKTPSSFARAMGMFADDALNKINSF